MSSTMAQASRIPRPILKRNLLKRTPSAPSKLEALKAQYQERQCQQRQRQLAPDSHSHSHQGPADYMVETNATKRGFLRDFFHERRNTDSGNLQYRYKKPIYDEDKVIGYTHHPVLPYHKNSAGRDKSNPLTPIQHIAKPPSGKHSKRSRGRHLQQNGLTPERGYSDTGTYSPDTLPFQQKPTLVRGRRRSRHASSSSSSTENAPPQESVNDSLPLNTAQLHHIHERQREIFSRRHSSSSSDHVALHKPKVIPQPTQLLKNTKLSSDSEDEEVFLRSPPRQPMQRPSLRQPARQPLPAQQPGLTDFQRWQAEQDHSRSQRLRNLRDKRPPDEVDQGWGGQMMPTPTTNKPTQLNLQKKERLDRMRCNILDDQQKHREDGDADKENTTGGGSVGQGGVLGEGDGMTEIQRKEHELMMRIQRGQEELEKMKQRRIQAHTQKKAEEDKKKREAAQKRLKMVSRAAERDELWDASEADVPDHHTVKKKVPQHRVASNENLKDTYSVKSVTPPPPRHQPPQRHTGVKKKAPYQPQVNLDNESTAFYANMASTSEAQDAPAVDMVACDLCGRRFAADRLAKHTTICAKVSQKKRKAFDPAKMRAKGTDNELYLRNGPQSTKRSQPQHKNNQWRQKHEEFIESLHYARKVATVQANGGNIADLPPPPRSQNPDYVACPYCERRFDKDVAERHIPRCKEIKARPAPPKKRK